MGPVNKRKADKNSDSMKKKEKADLVVSGQLQKKIDKKQVKKPKSPKGVVFIKHLPHGFFEDQLKNYFEQFGKVTRVRLVRSIRTGRSKGYAFIEFEYPEVASVAAETMNNYLMFTKIVKAYYIPPEKQQFNYFRTSVKKIRNKSGKLVWVSTKTAATQQKVKKQNDWSEENYQKRTKKQLHKLERFQNIFENIGMHVDEIYMPPKLLTEKDKNLQNISKAKVAKEESINVSSNTKRTPLKVNKVTIDCGKYSAKSNQYPYEEICSSAENLDRKIECESDTAEETLPILQKNIKKELKKSKPSNVERFDKMMKRKTHTGGITKPKKKSLKNGAVNSKKAALQISAAKELSKPLAEIKKAPKVKKILKK